MILSCGQAFGDSLTKRVGGVLGPSGCWQGWEGTTVCTHPRTSSCYLPNAPAWGSLPSGWEEQPLSKERVRGWDVLV